MKRGKCSFCVFMMYGSGGLPVYTGCNKVRAITTNKGRSDEESCKMASTFGWLREKFMEEFATWRSLTVFCDQGASPFWLCPIGCFMALSYYLFIQTMYRYLAAPCSASPGRYISRQTKYRDPGWPAMGRYISRSKMYRGPPVLLNKGGVTMGWPAGPKVQTGFRSTHTHAMPEQRLRTSSGRS